MDSILLLLGILAVVMIPTFMAQRRQKQMIARIHQLQDSLTIFDHVVTTAGIHGKVVAIAETTVDLEIASGVVTTWDKQVIVKNLSTEHAADEAEETHDEV